MGTTTRRQAAVIAAVALVLAASCSSSDGDGVEQGGAPASTSAPIPSDGAPEEGGTSEGAPDPDGFEPPANPNLADSPWPMSHRNPYNQASSPLPGPGPEAPDLPVRLVDAGQVAITVAFGPAYEDGSYPGWGSSFGTIYKARVAPDGSATVVEEIDEPAQLPEGAPIEAAISSAYTLVDAEGTFFAARGRRIRSYRDAEPGRATSPIERAATFEVTDELAPSDTIVALNMTWDGVLVAASREGVVMALSRGLELRSTVALDDGTEISNSIAIDEEGGIYVVTGSRVHRVQWTGDELSTAAEVGAWSAAYEPGPAVPAPGRLGIGSGTTPSLMGTDGGDELLVIADGRELMHVVVLWRDEIPDGWEPPEGADPRVAGVAPITFGDPGATRSITEQSITVRGYDAMVVSNTYGPPYDEATAGPVEVVTASGTPDVQPRGVELFRWDVEDDELTTRWSNPELSCPNGIPSMSAATGLAYCWGARDSVWTLEAIDWRSGESVADWPLGRGDAWNSFYAATEVGPFGSVVGGTVGGFGVAGGP